MIPLTSHDADAYATVIAMTKESCYISFPSSGPNKWNGAIDYTVDINVTSGKIMLPMVLSLIGGPLRQEGPVILLPFTFPIINMDGLELKTIYLKKYTHIMSVGYFLQYNAYFSKPCLIVLWKVSCAITHKDPP